MKDSRMTVKSVKIGSQNSTFAQSIILRTFDLLHFLFRIKVFLQSIITLFYVFSQRYVILRIFTKIRYE